MHTILYPRKPSIKPFIIFLATEVYPEGPNTTFKVNSSIFLDKFIIMLFVTFSDYPEHFIA